MALLHISRPVLLLALLSAFLFARPVAAQTPDLEPGTYLVTQPQGDLTRSYLLTVPQGYDPDVPLPLVIVLHGQTGSGERTRGYTGFDALADDQGFFVVYPDGVGGSWNDGRPGADASLPDDVAFIEELILRVSSAASIDPERVYVAGISAGGMFAYRLACTLPEAITAAAVVAATMPVYLEDACTGTPPVPLLLIHGTDDPIVPWTGIRSTFMTASATVSFWADHNGCIGALPPVDLPDADGSDGTRVIVTARTGCAAPVTLYAVLFGGHTWPGHIIPAIGLGSTSMDIDATAVIWQFFGG